MQLKRHIDDMQAQRCVTETQFEPADKENRKGQTPPSQTPGIIFKYFLFLSARVHNSYHSYSAQTTYFHT